VEHARSGLQKVVLEALAGAPPEERATLAWPLVCGSAVAAKTAVMSYAQRTLQVQVPDAVWRRQLSELLPGYVAAIRSIAPVERIEFVLPPGRR
jgi:hypothetical protein